MDSKYNPFEHTHDAEDYHAELDAATSKPALRPCGSCSLCCTVMAVKELPKPQNKKCCHLSILGKCTIYPQRPETCRTWDCLWKMGFVPEELVPERSRVVVADVKHLHGRFVMYLHVSPFDADAWKRGRFGEWVQELIEANWLIIAVCGDKRTLVGNNSEEFTLTATGEAPT